MGSEDAVLVERAERLAASILDRGRHDRRRSDRVRAARVARLLDDRRSLNFVLALTDEVGRIRDPARAASHLRSLVATATPSFLGPLDRVLLAGGSAAAVVAPRLVMSLVEARLRSELAGYVIPAESGPLRRHLARRRREGIRVNLNLLGEAVLGQGEADRRLNAVIALLQRRDVDYVSVKVSSICARLDSVAFDHEVTRVAVGLRRLYDVAMQQRPAKFVNLDMEEYRDLDLTVAVFRRVLSEESYHRLDAGIVLQAYLPDSLPALEGLVGWARHRHSAGGGAIKVRLVKGANLAMERVEAELAGWPAAPLATKAEVDANYKRMLDVVLDEANLGALRVGVATHNVFELAWALTLAADRHLAGMVEAEMLEGMAGALAGPVRDAAAGLVLYAPVVARRDHESATAYLVRRFDENTGPENFLHHHFDLQVGSPAWQAEARRFEDSVAARHHPAMRSRRTQDRTARTAPQRAGMFFNEPDTDLAIGVNRQWLASVMERARPGGGALPGVVPAVVGGKTIEAPARGVGTDPSAPGDTAYRWVQADGDLVERAVATARRAGPAWAATPLPERRRILLAVADRLALERGALVATMMAEGGKVFSEADPEVSEAIDFARWYAARKDGLEPTTRDGARQTPLGTVVVASPWNFPLAIPAGGVFAALAAGNAVILKPAPEAVATAWALARACWGAGVPGGALAFLPCADDEAGAALIAHPGVDAVILTGAWDTARMMIGWRPGMRLHAETSGKNAIVVTATADLDAAVADLVTSAFGHGGQKCSAASLAIVEASVYDDERFARQLADATRSLRPGPAWEPATTLGPLIRPPQGPLSAALAHLGPGESWLVEPHQVGANPHLWSPGIRLGVRPGGAFHLTECFGPVLGLMRAKDLDEAIRWQNAPAYGLTAGIHALDPAEMAHWLERVDAGNLYVNRHLTGARVGRQPFGGWKRSSLGPGVKAGGPHYVASLAILEGTFEGSPATFGRLVEAQWRLRMRPTDLAGLAAEANVSRYLPLPRVLLRAGTGTLERDLALAVAAAGALGVELSLSSPVPTEVGDFDRFGPGGVTVEDDEALVARLDTVGVDKLRLLGGASDRLRLAVHDAGLWLDDTEVVADAAIEARRWVREQSVCVTLHRHGDLTGRYDRIGFRAG